MKILFFCPRWGSEHLSYRHFFDKAKSAGYDGVEFSLPYDNKEKQEVIDLVQQTRLKYVAQHWETNTRIFEAHKMEYRKRLNHLADANPYFINAHTGKDYFSFEQNAELIAISDEIAAARKVRIVHETHRGRFSFAAHVTLPFLKKLPELELTLDLSHWCNVAESFLEDQDEAVQKALERTHHIHARVGFPEGPQIPDPGVPEWQDALEVHLGWWKTVMAIKQQKGEEIMTITPEFGPYPYMQILPDTKEPIADQWRINAFMMHYLKEHLC